MNRAEWQSFLRDRLASTNPIDRAWAAVQADRLTAKWLREDLEALS